MCIISKQLSKYGPYSSLEFPASGENKIGTCKKSNRRLWANTSLTAHELQRHIQSKVSYCTWTTKTDTKFRMLRCSCCLAWRGTTIVWRRGREWCTTKLPLNRRRDFSHTNASQQLSPRIQSLECSISYRKLKSTNKTLWNLVTSSFSFVMT